MVAARAWLTRRRKQLLLTLALVIAFILALVLWAGRSGDEGNALPSPPSGSSTPVDPSGSSSPGATDAASTAGTLPALPGFGTASGGPNRTDLTTFGPGQHRVVVTARSNASLLAVAYSIRGDAQGKVVYNVKSPVVIERTLTGGRPFAAVVLQVSDKGTSGSCSVTVDGKVIDTRSTTQPYAVIGCTA